MSKRLNKVEIVKWLLENCVDERGNLDLEGLDFSEFKGLINISKMKAGGDLYQGHQQVKGGLNQSWQQVECNLWQYGQEVGNNLYQTRQVVKGELLSHKLEDNEVWVNKGNSILRVSVKKLQPITKQELENMGYKLKEEN